MSLTMADGGVEAVGGRSKRQNSLLRKQLALAVRSVQWNYAIFWSSSLTQPGVLEWGEGCYNGDMKKRKKSYESHYKHGLQRSKQLRKLYLSMLEGDSGTTVSTTHVEHNDDDVHSCGDSTTNMMLPPDDLSDEEWYYLVSMSYVFSPSQCLPGRASATGETIWLCNAQYAENKLFSRSLLARSASIQTVVCFPHLGGVIELGVTELISEDHSLLQHIKSCLLEISFLQKNDDEKKMGIMISGANLMLEEKHQIPLGISDEDLHYKRTVSTVLNYSVDRSSRSDKMIHHRQRNLASSDPGSSFLRWKQCEQPNSDVVQKQSDLQPQSQNVLRKMLYNVPLMMRTKRMFPTQRSGMNQDDPSDRRKENEKFSVLRTMVPTVNEVDKESILNNTIKYLQELEARVEELESCMGSVNFVERQRKTTENLNDSVLIEETSGNYDDSTKIDENSGETEQVTVFRDKTHLRVKLKETEVVIEVRCSYRDYIVADIMETLSNLHMDAFSVRSHTLNKFLTLNLKAKFRGAAVASVGMIKRELRRVIGDLF
ncbi:PREDICTED: transcription factor MYC1-like [Camelina sativa]|uniref:Transcription factor MYC1-like n=1 Tax=Camelina sativa TaxID=90675 RepID=A0ABM0T1N9_CAMSA|nr:PREDICTED: transcription factor MYC1-like [Camelina sativa]